jgi:putative endonuclease
MSIRHPGCQSVILDVNPSSWMSIRHPGCQSVILSEAKDHNVTEKIGYVYILTNSADKVLYVGVTSNLIKRIYEHKNKLVDGFSQKYNLTKLVYYEVLSNMYSAITREKQLKGLLRSKKIVLIQSKNPYWADLYYKLL